MEHEIWKPVKGFEGLYEISSLGRVKSLWYGKEKILKPGKNRKGYLFVSLCRNGKQKNFRIHRLVAEAFLSNPMGLPEVNHKDENKANNCVNNLEFCDAKYNSNYGHRNERVASALTNHPDKSKAVEASRFSDFSEICLRFSSTADAGRNGYTQSAVATCCRGCYSTHRGNFYKGLYWRYAC